MFLVLRLGSHARDFPVQIISLSLPNSRATPHLATGNKVIDIRTTFLLTLSKFVETFISLLQNSACYIVAFPDPFALEYLRTILLKNDFHFQKNNLTPHLKYNFYLILSFKFCIYRYLTDLYINQYQSWIVDKALMIPSRSPHLPAHCFSYCQS